MTNTDVFHLVCDAMAAYELRFCRSPGCDDACIVLHPRRYREILTDNRYFMCCGSIGLLFNQPMLECADVPEDQALIIAPPNPRVMAEAVMSAIEFWGDISGVGCSRVGCSPEDIAAMCNYELGTDVDTDASLPPGMFWLRCRHPTRKVTAVVRPHEVEWLNAEGVPTLPIRARLSAPEEAPHILTAAIQDLYATCGTAAADRDEIAAIFGVPPTLLGPSRPIVLGGDSAPQHEPFGDPGGEPAIDICDEISALVDDQLGHESSGYDHNIHQPRCACGEDWHGLPITEKMKQMRGRRLVESDYVYARDKSVVLCRGTPTAGTWKGAHPKVVLSEDYPASFAELPAFVERRRLGGTFGNNPSWAPLALALLPELDDGTGGDFYPGGHVNVGVVSADTGERLGVVQIPLSEIPLSTDDDDTEPSL